MELSIDEKLQKLRKDWLVADSKGRKIIEIRAKLLKLKKETETADQATEVFLKSDNIYPDIVI